LTCRIFSLGLCLAVFGASLGGGLAGTPLGQVKIFSLQRPDQDPTQEPPELRSPWIYGLSWRFKWRTIEPHQGQYRWDLIDSALAVTGQSGKKAMLRITAGINSPDWVYQAGARPFAFRNLDLAHPEHYPARLRMPIPWDDVYLAAWEAFIHTFGKRYNGHPHIYSIQMTGGGHIGEMNLPKAHTQWLQVGYTDAKLIAAWKRIIAAYQRAFPDRPINLDINEPLGRRSHVLEPIVAYVLTAYPHKVYLQHNGLKADFPRDHRLRRIIREASTKTVVGYQMVGGKGFLERQTGDRWAAFRQAWEDGASYLEVYASDIRDPTQQEALQRLSTLPERR
jgi:hypothetical protein